MKRILFLFIATLTGVSAFSQAITVDNTTYTVPQLVQDVLFASGSTSSSCVGTISNITWSTGSDASDGTSFGSTNGIGYFQNTNPDFPLSSGIVLSSGDALDAPGPNNTIQEAGDWPGDSDLFNYIDGLGIDPGLIDYNNATVLEFDFTPLTTMMSFDFLFASEEYGEYQCLYSDSFAFFLTNVTTGSAPTNLALVPGTPTPISVVTIRDGANFTGFGTNCGSTNASYFGNFNDSTPAVRAAAATNFNGETVLMTATSAVIPNNLYHIKLVVADRNDDLYDSAVFLGGGSFDIGTADLVGTGEFNGIPDFTVANNTAVCSSKPIVVQAGSVVIPGATYEWTWNGNPVGTNTNVYTITQAGTYGITITYPGGCRQNDSMVVEYIPSLTLGTPSDLTQCTAPFNLTDNSSAILNGITNPITYHHSLIQAQGLASPILNPSTYNGTDGEIIYAAVEDDVTGCIVTTQFVLHTNPSLCLVSGIPPDLFQYETTPGSGVSVFNFTPQTTIIYGTNTPADYTVIYYPTLADANARTNPIAVTNSFQNTSSPQRIYAVLSQNVAPTNFVVTSFQLVTVALPVVSISASLTYVCIGNSATITFSGTPNAIVDYTVDGNPRQITLNGFGTNFDITPPLNSSTTFNLVSATITTPAGTTTQPEVGTVTITIASRPTINTPTPFVVCDDSLDGLYCFDLTTKINEITGGDPTVVVDFYETTTSGVSQSSPYCTISPGIQTLDVRAHFIGSSACYSTTSLNLVVNPIPLPNPIITDYELCDYNNPGDGVE
ncbi:choice-of-anchor L domain-containing protein, partial [Flavobacterium paronense]